jgi:hypothetical protein
MKRTAVSILILGLAFTTFGQGPYATDRLPKPSVAQVEDQLDSLLLNYFVKKTEERQRRVGQIDSLFIPHFSDSVIQGRHPITYPIGFQR